MKAALFRTLSASCVLLATAHARADVEPLPALTVAFEGGVMGRTLRWNDDLFGKLRAFTLAAAPSFAGEVVVHPGAFVTTARPAWIGLAARAEGIAFASTQRAGHDDALSTHAWAFSTAVRGRVPYERGATWLDAGLAGRAFTVDAAGITTPDVPSVRYLGPRLGLGSAVSLPARFSLSGEAGLARWLSTGDLTSAAWFPHARAWGADVRLRVAWSAPRGFSPYLDLAWSRDVAALRPQPGDANVAGGMVDDRLSARIGLSWTLPSPTR